MSRMAFSTFPGGICNSVSGFGFGWTLELEPNRAKRSVRIFIVVAEMSSDLNQQFTGNIFPLSQEPRNSLIVVQVFIFDKKRKKNKSNVED